MQLHHWILTKCIMFVLAYLVAEYPVRNGFGFMLHLPYTQVAKHSVWFGIVMAACLASSSMAFFLIFGTAFQIRLKIWEAAIESRLRDNH